MENNNPNENSFLVNNPTLNTMDLPQQEPIGQNSNGEKTISETEIPSFLTNNPALNTMDLPQLEPIGQNTDDNSIGGRHR